MKKILLLISSLFITGLIIAQPCVAITGFTVTSPSCFGGNNGSISVTYSAGVAPYVISVSGSPSQSFTTSILSQSIGGLNANSHNIVITDNNGCQSFQSVSVIDPSPLLISASSWTYATCGLANGLASLTVSGGTPSYNVVWNLPGSPVGTSQTNMPPGVWTATITDANGCVIQNSISIANLPFSSITSFSVTSPSCFGLSNGAITVNYSSGVAPYSVTWSNPISQTTNSSALTQSIAGVSSGVYSATVTDNNGCTTFQPVNVTQPPQLNVISSASSQTVCNGSCETLFVAAMGGTPPYTYSINAVSFNSYSVSVCPAISSIYTITGADANNCLNTETVSITVDNTCADVWPGDANSDGTADNLDVLELGLHYAQTGAPRASISNLWQSYFANNWAGTISNGKNLNHGDCNGDGTINNDDTLAIYNNYGLTHALKPVQTNTANPELTIVPDQTMVIKGNWGTASVYLGDATTTINNINGVAFTVDFDNTLIEQNSIYMEYLPSFIDASQNLHFQKLDFNNGNVYTASTHTVNNNVSGFGKIATLHYQILSSLATDQVLNISLSLANQSSASGSITPLTSGTGTLMAIGASVGLNDNALTGVLVMSPNPTNSVLNILSSNDLQFIEVTNVAGQVLLKQICTDKIHSLQLQNFAEGIYFVKVVYTNGISVTKKILVNR